MNDATDRKVVVDAKKRSRAGCAVAVVAGVMIALAGCAPEPQATSTPTPTPSDPAPYDGPLVFTGDGLESLLPTAEEISALLPEAADVSAPSAALEQISDGGGLPATPAICDALYLEQSLGSVGARVVEWATPADPEYGQGRMMALQFADPEQASSRMDQMLRAASECAQFTKEAPATFDSVTLDEKEGVRAFAGTLLDVDAGYDWRVFQGYAAVGNVMVTLWQPFTGDRTFDAQAAAQLLQDRAAEASVELIAELTENPPVDDEEPVTDAAQPWSEWQITSDGVGPILLGDAVDVAVAAAGGVATAPSYQGGPWIIADSTATTSLAIQPAEGADVVWYITVGEQRPSGTETPQDGAALPARGEIRVGAALSDAIAAFPGGTSVDVVSSSEHYYAVATRDGRVFRFDTAAEVSDGSSAITGITVEDATARQDLSFD